MIPDKINQNAFEADWTKGVSIRAMVVKYRVSQTTLRRVRLEMGLPDRERDTNTHPPETIKRIATLWAEGKSASEIARAFGGRWTRNMVVSLVNRNNLSTPERKLAAMKAGAIRRPKPVRIKKERCVMDAAIRPQKVKPEPVKGEGPMLGVPFPKLSPEKTDEVRAARAATGRQAIKGMDAVANDNAVPLMERKFGQCAWPVGTPDRPRNQLVCGALTYEGVENCPYCVIHAKRAFARDVTQPKPKDNIVRAVRRWAA